ncbi:hypothetical protein D8674_021687 [Pyrus ussuriensis x Pyrus communis]|uniref:Uncharacterized protein n=1 Tax=Pyrus ussuriensis x Pyrus communis TaxID=2448454 RepID=A0A5N5GHU5_9ROSA|nr:hypothetical protein D8674_021687 [Pyrus ussuriensis x Pyrus communis]
MTCMVPLMRSTKLNEKFMFAMQFTRSWKNGEVTLLATMKKDKLVVDISLVPKIVHLLKEFGNVMPKELLKKLPPRIVVDHAIDN